MAALDKRTAAPSLSSQLPDHGHQYDGTAGEDIEAGDACYLDDDGLIKLAVGEVGNDDTALVLGFAAEAAKEDEQLTVYWNVYFGYGDVADIDVGAKFYLSESVDGGLDTTPNGPAIAFGVKGGNLYLTGNWDKVTV